MKIAPRTLTAAVLGALTAAVLTACATPEVVTGQAAPAAPVVTAAPAATRAAAPTRVHTTLVDTAFVRTIREGTSIPSNKPDSELVVIAEVVCGLLDSDPTLRGFLSTIDVVADANAWSTDDAAFMVGVSVAAYCPRHKPLFEEN